VSVPEFQPSNRLPIGFWKLCLLLAVVVGLSLLIVPAVYVLMLRMQSPAVVAIAVTMAAQSAVMFGVLYLLGLKLWGITWRQIGWTPPSSFAWYLRAILFALAAILIVALITFMIESMLGEPLDNPQVGMLAPGSSSVVSTIVMLVLVAVVAPIAEELLFRGVVYRWIAERFGMWTGLLVSSLIFSCVHGILALILPLFVVGCLLAWLYEKSGSVLPCIVMHGVFNGMMLLGLYAGLAAGVQP
jgi:membrane protease YdiL (CAAX protease family)